MRAFDANIDSNVETTKSPLTSAHCCDPFTVYEKSPQLALFKFHMEGLGELPPKLTGKLDESVDFDMGGLEIVVGDTVDVEDGIALALVLMLVMVLGVFVMALPSSLILLPGSPVRALGLVPVPKLDEGAATAPVA